MTVMAGDNDIFGYHTTGEVEEYGNVEGFEQDEKAGDEVNEEEA